MKIKVGTFAIALAVVMMLCLQVLPHHHHHELLCASDRQEAADIHAPQQQAAHNADEALTGCVGHGQGVTLCHSHHGGGESWGCVEKMNYTKNNSAKSSRPGSTLPSPLLPILAAALLSCPAEEPAPCYSDAYHLALYSEHIAAAKALRAPPAPLS